MIWTDPNTPRLEKDHVPKGGTRLRRKTGQPKEGQQSDFSGPAIAPAGRPAQVRSLRKLRIYYTLSLLFLLLLRSRISPNLGNWWLSGPRKPPDPF